MKDNKYSPLKYLITNNQDLDWGLIVTTAGHQNIPANTSYPLSNHPVRYLYSPQNGRILNEYQLIYISRGCGYFISSNQNKIEVKEGHMFLLFPGEWHNYWPSPKTGWRESWIGFTGMDVEQKVDAGFFTKENPVFTLGVNEKIIELYKLAVETAKEQNSGYQQLLAGIVNLLLGYTYSEHRRKNFEDINITNQINNAKIIMQENIQSNILGEEVAEEIGVSYSKFRKVFKQYTGFSPAQYLEELRINKAKELLTNTTLLCKEIAYESGFNSPSYFNIAFKNKTEMSPKQYREMTQKTSV